MKLNKKWKQREIESEKEKEFTLMMILSCNENKKK